MSTLSERLIAARNKHRYSQERLANAIGVTRGVIINLELPEDSPRAKKTEPQAIVINAICNELHINKEWLMTGQGEMEKDDHESKMLQSICEEAADFSPAELEFLMRTIAAMKQLRIDREPVHKTRALDAIVQNAKSRTTEAKPPGKEHER